MRQIVVGDIVFTGIPEVDFFLFILGCLWFVSDKIFNPGNPSASSEYESSGDQDLDQSKGHQKDNPSERQKRQLVKCAMDHCNSLSFRNSEYCWRHQDRKGPETDGPSWWEEGGSSL